MKNSFGLRNQTDPRRRGDRIAANSRRPLTKDGARRIAVNFARPSELCLRSDTGVSRNSNKQSRWLPATALLCCSSVPRRAVCSSARRPLPLRPFGMHYGSCTSSQGVLWLLPLLTLHNTWQHLQSLEDKERSPSRSALL